MRPCSTSMPQPVLSPSNRRPTTKRQRCGRQQCLQHHGRRFRWRRHDDQSCCGHRHQCRRRGASLHLGWRCQLCRECNGHGLYGLRHPGIRQITDLFTHGSRCLPVQHQCHDRRCDLQIVAQLRSAWRCRRQQCLRRQGPASDGTNFSTKDVAISVTNVNEAPTVTSAATASVGENAAGTVYTVAATDPDAGTTLTYSLSGADAALFDINATTGVITFKSSPNYEAPADVGGNNVYDVTVGASDGTITHHDQGRGHHRHQCQRGADNHLR